MVKEIERVCPIFMISEKSYEKSKCIKDLCAWWLRYQKACAIQVGARIETPFDNKGI